MATLQRNPAPVDERGTRRRRMFRLTLLALLFLIAARGAAARTDAAEAGASPCVAGCFTCHADEARRLDGT